MRAFKPGQIGGHVEPCDGCPRCTQADPRDPLANPTLRPQGEPWTTRDDAELLELWRLSRTACTRRGGMAAHEHRWARRRWTVDQWADRVPGRITTSAWKRLDRLFAASPWLVEPR